MRTNSTTGPARALALGLSVGLAAATGAAPRSAAAQPPTKPSPTAAGPGFRGTADLSDVVQIARGFSQDKQAVTVIFRNLEADLGGRNDIQADSRTVTVVLPVDNAEKGAQVHQDIRGFVNVQGKSRALLVVQACGETTVVDLKKARDDAKAAAGGGGPSKPVTEARGQAKEELKALPPADANSGSGSDFQTRITGKVPAGGKYQVTFFLMIERDATTADSNGLITVDSLDVEIEKSAPGTASGR